MWLSSNIIADVDRVARIHYINKTMTKRWNDNRDPSELRLLTGWCWTSRNGERYQQGLKTITVAYREAWYALVAKREAPRTTRLRLVKTA